MTEFSEFEFTALVNSGFCVVVVNLGLCFLIGIRKLWRTCTLLRKKVVTEDSRLE